MELIIRFVAMAVNGEPVGVLCVASSSSTDHIKCPLRNKKKNPAGRGGSAQAPF